MPASHDDRIPITSAADLATHLRDIQESLAEKETEHSWQRLDRALFRLEAITKGGAYKYDDFLVFMKTVAGPVSRSLLSDRTRLSGTAADVISSVAPRLAERFEPLVPLYVSPLLQLCARTNKVALKRAEKCLQLIAKHCRLASTLPLLCDAVRDKFAGLRVAALACIVTLLDNAGAQRLHRRVADLEATIKLSATDSNPEVRQWSRRLFEAYCQGWPSRVESFVAPLDLTTRRYLALPKTGSVGGSGSGGGSGLVDADADDDQQQHSHAASPAPSAPSSPSPPLRAPLASTLVQPDTPRTKRSKFLQQLAAARAQSQSKSRAGMSAQVQSTGALGRLAGGTGAGSVGGSVGGGAWGGGVGWSGVGDGGGGRSGDTAGVGPSGTARRMDVTGQRSAAGTTATAARVPSPPTTSSFLSSSLNSRADHPSRSAGHREQEHAYPRTAPATPAQQQRERERGRGLETERGRDCGREKEREEALPLPLPQTAAPPPSAHSTEPQDVAVTTGTDTAAAAAAAAAKPSEAVARRLAATRVPRREKEEEGAGGSGSGQALRSVSVSMPPRRVAAVAGSVGNKPKATRVATAAAAAPSAKPKSTSTSTASKASSTSTATKAVASTAEPQQPPQPPLPQPKATSSTSAATKKTLVKRTTPSSPAKSKPKAKTTSSTSTALNAKRTAVGPAAAASSASSSTSSSSTTPAMSRREAIIAARHAEVAKMKAENKARCEMAAMSAKELHAAKLARARSARAAAAIAVAAVAPGAGAAGAAGQGSDQTQVGEARQQDGDYDDNGDGDVKVQEDIDNRQGQVADGEEKNPSPPKTSSPPKALSPPKPSSTSPHQAWTTASPHGADFAVHVDADADADDHAATAPPPRFSPRRPDVPLPPTTPRNANIDRLAQSSPILAAIQQRTPRTPFRTLHNAGGGGGGGDVVYSSPADKLMMRLAARGDRDLMDGENENQSVSVASTSMHP